MVQTLLVLPTVPMVLMLGLAIHNLVVMPMPMILASVQLMLTLKPMHSTMVHMDKVREIFSFQVFLTHKFFWLRVHCDNYQYTDSCIFFKEVK